MAPHSFIGHVKAADLALCYGRVKRIGLTHIEADGPICSIGDICNIEQKSDHSPHLQSIAAEVVGVESGKVTLLPLEANTCVQLNARVIGGGHAHSSLGVGDSYAGRAIDSLGRPIDGRGAIVADMLTSPVLANPGPLERAASQDRLETGVRSIDGLLTLAKGQRVGVFAAAGVGKTSLIEQLSSQVGCDRCIICLVGERGREVEAMWQKCLGASQPERFTMVASTSDQSAALRMRAGHYALALANYWRSRGEHVLLVMDSVTRLAMAMREIGLAAGEPPTIRAYTPSVFTAIPKFVEHCGALRSGGAITAIMTVLAETDDVDDPIAEMMKSLLDGHIILSRQMAEQGHFPAIDVSRSISRQAEKLMSKEHRQAATTLRKLLSIYEESRTLVESGVYRSGSNSELDQAIAMRPAIMDFLSQGQDTRSEFDASLDKLTNLLMRVPE
ncbi:FliI/YscN family ATPase [Sphingorhabdus sp. Alg239-R122]|uniref:FliI/YscN family ATPase n=1 Tax=Sphingorhabdus sp. Alg239-R122 TaxID=2305989 RepID=UPI001967CDB4|nr:FliI/YscN family ATPase [Sphingorhabdus sp. Alg239-R122]